MQTSRPPQHGLLTTLFYTPGIHGRNQRSRAMDILGKDWNSSKKVEGLLEAKASLEFALKMLDGFGLSIAANHVQMSLDLIQSELRSLGSY